MKHETTVHSRIAYRGDISQNGGRLSLRGVLGIAFYLLLISHAALAADAKTIFVGEPTTTGETRIGIKKPNGDNVTVIIKVKKDAAGKLILDNDKPATDENKRDLIFAKMAELGVSGTKEGTRRIKDIDGIFMGEVDGTGEHDGFSSLRPKRGTMDFEFVQGVASLAGVDASGREATYAGGVGFTDVQLGNILLSTNLHFSELSPPTIRVLLNDIFLDLRNQLAILAPGVLGSLSLDLPRQEITFLYPETALEGFVDAGTTDLALTSSLSISSVPEPTTIVLLSIGLVVLFGIGWRVNLTSLKL